jgi:hypothetical protein
VIPWFIKRAERSRLAGPIVDGVRLGRVEAATDPETQRELKMARAASDKLAAEASEVKAESLEDIARAF